MDLDPNLLVTALITVITAITSTFAVLRRLTKLESLVAAHALEQTEVQTVLAKHDERLTKLEHAA